MLKNWSKSMLISVILPTYNERGNIVFLIKEILKAAKKNKSLCEIIVVDDDSADGTATEVKKNFKGSRVKVFVRKEDRGLAKAIYYGVKKARGKIVAVMDSDFNHDPKLVFRMVDRINTSDIVIGSRYMKGGGMENKKREILSKIFNLLLVKWILASPVNDNLSGFFAMRRKRLLALDANKIFYGYGDYFIRLIYLAKKKEYTFLEVPCFYKNRPYGQSKSILLWLTISYFLSAVRCRLEL